MTLTAQDLQRATQAKSDQLNSCDLLGGAIVAKILDVKSGSSEQPVIIVIDSWPQPWKPSKTSLRVLSACWGNDPSVWIGRYAVLYCDEAVTFGKEAIGGVRTSHLSHITGRKVISVNSTRGKKAAQIVEPYYPQDEPQPEPEVQFYPQEKFDANLAAWVDLIDSGKKTVEQIVANVERGGKLTAGQRSRIKATPAVQESAPAEFIGNEDPFGDPPTFDE